MYQTFYQFNAKPFSLNPDPFFFFGSRGHKRAMSYLRYGLTQGEGFIVITGDTGTGKTILVRTLFASLARENVIAAQLVTTHLNADEMLKMVAASFGLAHEGLTKATLLKNLETFLVTRAREGKRILLVIDEAQNLPVQALEELRMLSNFELSGRILLQSFLLGQASFRDTLHLPQMEQLRQRIIAAYHLNPLDSDETQGYIEHRMKLVGWRGDPQITEQAFDRIHAITDGIPRPINQLCDRLLLYGCLEDLHELDEDSVNTVADELRRETAMLGDDDDSRNEYSPERYGGEDGQDMENDAGERPRLAETGQPGERLSPVQEHSSEESDIVVSMARIEARLQKLEELMNQQLRGLREILLSREED